jgi:nitrogen fixation protein FixH
MSYLGWEPPQQPARSRWRFFPLAVIAGMAVVVAVNAGMVYAALHSFPGSVHGDEGFDLSNHYDAVLAQERHETALGWVIVAQTDETGRAMVALTGHDGTPLHNASVNGSAARPLGAPQTRALDFHETDRGRYIADVPLPTSGQWELTLSAFADGETMAVTRRVIVR